MPSTACYLHLRCSWGSCHCRGNTVWPSTGPTLGLEGEAWDGAAAPKAIPQQKRFTAHDICTVQSNGNVTNIYSKRHLEKNSQIFQRLKSKPIHPTLPMKMFSSTIRNTSLKQRPQKTCIL